MDMTGQAAAGDVRLQWPSCLAHTPHPAVACFPSQGLPPDVMAKRITHLEAQLKRLKKELREAVRHWPLRRPT